MIKKILTTIVLLISFTAFSQKGIFKKGKVIPSTYKEYLTYELKQNAIYMNVILDNKTYNFLVDTGAPTTLSTKVKGDFTLLKEKEIRDASNNKQMVNYITVPRLQIGKLTYEGFAVMYEHLDLFDELGIDGIIGANIISKSAWNFDLVNQKITVSNEMDEKELSKNFKKIKVVKNTVGTPTLTFSYFNKIKEKNIFFDTGYNDFFYLSRPMFVKLKKGNLISQMIEGNGHISTSAFGSNEGKTYMTPLQVNVGKHSLPMFLSDVDDDEESNLGSVWLKYYQTVLYKNHLYFKANNKEFFKTEFKSFGFKTDIVNNNLLVTFVWNTSTAVQKQGIKLNDKILSIDNKDLSELTIEELNQSQVNLGKLEKVRLEINTKGNFIDITKEILLAF